MWGICFDIFQPPHKQNLRTWYTLRLLWGLSMVILCFSLPGKKKSVCTQSSIQFSICFRKLHELPFPGCHSKRSTRGLVEERKYHFAPGMLDLLCSITKPTNIHFNFTRYIMEHLCQVTHPNLCRSIHHSDQPTPTTFRWSFAFLRRLSHLLRAHCAPCYAHLDCTRLHQEELHGFTRNGQVEILWVTGEGRLISCLLVRFLSNILKVSKSRISTSI